ncbi:MAG: hypothetical protein JSV76_04065, partial [Candidatus Bathyarchaeota archaeon]
MEKRGHVVLFVFMILGASSLPIVTADPGLGLATPMDSLVTIDAFPFRYESSFRVYNTGDEEGIIIVKVIVPYLDINDWVSVDSSVFLLQPQESKVIHFNLTANEGYTGIYEIVFQPTLLPTQEAESGAMVYLGISGSYELTVEVPSEVGTLSLGERPPELPGEVEPEDFTRQIGPINETGIIVETFGKTIVLDLPSAISVDETYDVSVSFLGGGEPIGLGFVFISPSGKQLRCSRIGSVTFNEQGEWIALVVVDDQTILGKTLMAQYNMLSGLLRGNLIQYSLVIVTISVIALFLLMRRKKKQERVETVDWPDLPYYVASLMNEIKRDDNTH